MKSRGRRFLTWVLAVLTLVGMQASVVLASGTGDRITGLKIERGGGHGTTILFGGFSSDSLDLTAVAEGGTPDEYKWTCSNSAVVELSADNGDAITVTPRAKGSARITVTAKNATNFKTASISVRVVQLATDIKITDQSGVEITGDLKVYLGKSVSVKALVDTSASMKTVDWESSDPTVATVTGGRIVGKSEGTVTITAATKGWTDIADRLTAAITVQVTKAASSIEIDKDGTDVAGQVLKYSLEGGAISPESSFDLVATALMEDGSDADAQTFKWMTSNKKTADLSVSTDTRTATIRLGAKGTAVISARDQTSGKRFKVTVQVSKVPTGVDVSPVSGGTSPVQLAEGKSVTMRAVVAPADANNRKVTWSSSDTTVATVSTTGKVIGIQSNPDPVTITATTVDGGKVGTIEVKVLPAVSEMKIMRGAEDVTGMSAEVINDGTVTTVALKAEGTRSDGTPYDAGAVEWNVSGSKAADFGGGDTKATGETATVHIKAAGKATVTAKATDGSGKKAIYKIVVLQPATSVQPSNGVSAYEVGVGKAVILKAKVGPGDASKKTVTWSTGNPDIVSVNAKTGRVAGLSRGTATVTATADGGNSVECDFTVTVKDMAESVQLSDAGSGELLNGSTLTFNVGSGDTADLKAEVIPATAVGKIIWTSSRTRVAKVVPTGDGTTATVTPVGRGSTQIRAKAADGSNRFAVMTVKVTVPVQDIEIVPDTASVAVGRGIYLKPKFTPDDATNKKVTWASDNPSVADVTSTGRVVGKTAGAAAITVTSEEGISATCHVTVNPAVSKVVLYKDGVGIGKTLDVLLSDGDVSLRADVEPSDASQDVVWSSSNTKVASVNQNGDITLHSIGSANIRVKSTDGTNRSAYVVLRVKRVLD